MGKPQRVEVPSESEGRRLVVTTQDPKAFHSDSGWLPGIHTGARDGWAWTGSALHRRPWFLWLPSDPSFSGSSNTCQPPCLLPSAPFHLPALSRGAGPHTPHTLLLPHRPAGSGAGVRLSSGSWFTPWNLPQPGARPWCPCHFVLLLLIHLPCPPSPPRCHGRLRLGDYRH